MTAQRQMPDTAALVQLCELGQNRMSAEQERETAGCTAETRLTEENL